MRSSSLAERVLEFDAMMASMDLRPEPSTRKVVSVAGNVDVAQRRRRGARLRSIEIRDQGLRPFRVC